MSPITAWRPIECGGMNLFTAFDILAMQADDYIASVGFQYYTYIVPAAYYRSASSVDVSYSRIQSEI